MAYTTLISVEALADHLSDPDWAIIDCRFSLANPDQGEIEYHQSHIPGSCYAHLDRDLSSPVVKGSTGRHPLPEVISLIEKLRKWGVNNDSQVVVYDHSHGGIAARLWWLLRWIGHEEVAVLDGGWAAWRQGGKPVSDLLPAVKRGNIKANVRQELTVTADQVEEIRKKQSWRLVDSREQKRYLGLEEPIDPVAGHIDGAINHHFAKNVNEDGTWKSTKELRTSFSEDGIANDAAKTVFYCGSGVTACHNLLAYMHAELGEALLYPGSWSEWITRR